jgi:hypothetical protein
MHFLAFGGIGEQQTLQVVLSVVVFAISSAMAPSS